MICFRAQSLSISFHDSLQWTEPNPTIAQLFEVIYCLSAIMLKMQFIQKQPLCHWYASIWVLFTRFFPQVSVSWVLLVAPKCKTFQALQMCFELEFLYFLIFMISATPCIVSFDKYFRQHQGIILLWFVCQQATRESFSRLLWSLWCWGQDLLPCSCGTRSKSTAFSYQVRITTSSHWPDAITFEYMITIR